MIPNGYGKDNDMNKFDDPLDAIEEIIKNNKRSAKCFKLIKDEVLYWIYPNEADDFVSYMIDRAMIHNKLWSVFHITKIAEHFDKKIKLVFS
jgi:alpha-L-arabinofuranosidase